MNESSHTRVCGRRRSLSASESSPSDTRWWNRRSVHQPTRSVDTVTAKRSKRAPLRGVERSRREVKRELSHSCMRAAAVVLASESSANDARWWSRRSVHQPTRSVDAVTAKRSKPARRRGRGIPGIPYSFGHGYSRLPSDTSHESSHISHLGCSNRYGTNVRSRRNIHITLTSHNHAPTSDTAARRDAFKGMSRASRPFPRRLHSSSKARIDAPSGYGPDDTRGAHRHPQTSAQRPRTGAQHARKTCTNCGLRRPTDEARRRWRGLRRRS